MSPRPRPARPPEPSGRLYLARPFVQTTLPHRRPKFPEFTRRNGHLTLHLQAPASLGLPYGTYPRWFLLWLTTEAVRTRSPHLHLGPSLSAFMDRLGLAPTSGKRGTKHQLRLQIRRLLATTFRWTQRPAPGTDITRSLLISHRHSLSWSPGPAAEPFRWPSTLTLSQDLFTEILAHPVPLDASALRRLHPSSFAIDIYAWLRHRLSYLERPCRIPWARLQEQFGAEYGRPRDFRRYFCRYLEEVRGVYPGAGVETGKGGLSLKRWQSTGQVQAMSSPAGRSEAQGTL